MGKLTLDPGAVKAIAQERKSLLAAGITAIAGEFESQEAVELCDLNGLAIARGIVNYNRSELQQILGRHSSEISTILGYAAAETVVHRDNLVLT